jgi:transposase
MAQPNVRRYGGTIQGRRRLPADLPRERIEIMPPAGEQRCATRDTTKVRIGADTTEELDQVPASLVIRQ